MGEYPLSFSACLNQMAAYHIILSAGADPDSVDTNGNSVVHMMVIHNNKEMLNMVYENGASSTLRNRQGFTPLSLAAKLGNKDLFFHILAINQIVYWKVGNIVAAVTPLGDLDTINAETGALDPQTALNQVVFGKGKNHLSLIDGVLLELLRVKWTVFIKRKFYTMLFIFLAYAFLVTSYMLSEETIAETEVCHKLLTKIINTTANLTGNINTSIEHVSPHGNDGLHAENISEKIFLHFIIFLFSIGFHCEAIYENFYLGSRCLYQTLLLCPSRIIFLSRLANSFLMINFNLCLFTQLTSTKLFVCVQLLDCRSVFLDKIVNARVAGYPGLLHCFDSSGNLALLTFLLQSFQTIGTICTAGQQGYPQ